MDLLSTSIFLRALAPGLMQRQRHSGDRGSSLIETAMVVPILVLVLCFAIDIGYFFIVAANLVSSSRNAVLYSGQGFVGARPAVRCRPPERRDRLAIRQELLDWREAILPAWRIWRRKPRVQVCSKKIGITQTSSGYITNCSTFPSGSLSFAPDQDPDVELRNADPTGGCGLHASAHRFQSISFYSRCRH